MPMITIAEAVRIAKVSRSTISRSIRSGKMSVVTLANGQVGIDPSELERVFPSDAPRKRNQQHMVIHAQQEDNENNVSINTGHEHVQTLSEQCAFLRKRLEQAEATIQELLADQRRMVSILEDDRRKAFLMIDRFKEKKRKKHGKGSKKG